MDDAPKGNGKSTDGNGKANGRNRKGQFTKDAPHLWKKGQSGNPKGYRSLGSLLTAALRKELVDETGQVRMEAIEVLAQRAVNWAIEPKPGKAYAPRQLLALKLLFERFDPVALKIQHEHSGRVAVALTPAARAFQLACAEWSHEHNGESPGIAELREIRNRMSITDSDLGINGDGH